MAVWGLRQAGFAGGKGSRVMLAGMRNVFALPSGLVENQKDMLVRADGFGEFIQIDLHGVG